MFAMIKVFVLVGALVVISVIVAPAFTGGSVLDAGEAGRVSSAAFQAPPASRPDNEASKAIYNFLSDAKGFQDLPDHEALVWLARQDLESVRAEISQHMGKALDGDAQERIEALIRIAKRMIDDDGFFVEPGTTRGRDE